MEDLQFNSLFSKPSCNKLYSKNVQVSYFNNSYETNVLSIFPIPNWRIRIYTIVEDFENQFNNHTIRNNNYNNKNDGNISNEIDLDSLGFDYGFGFNTKEKMEEIYNDIPSTSIIYLKKDYRIESLWIHGVNGSLLEVYLGTNTRSIKNRINNKLETNHNNQIKHNINLEDTIESRKSVNYKKEYNELINNIFQSYIKNTAKIDMNTGSNIKRNAYQSRKDAEEIKDTLKLINLSKICRSWIWRKLKYDQHLNEKGLLGLNSNQNQTSKKLPVPRSGHQLQSFKDSLFLFLGYNGTEDLEDCWEYRIKYKSWHCISLKTSRQGGLTKRSCHQSTIHGDFVYFLGRYSDSKSNSNSDFYRFNMNSFKWDKLSQNTLIEGGPPLIYDHQMCTVNDDIYVFGGRIAFPPEETSQNGNSTYETNYSGLYCYNIPLGKWKKIQFIINLRNQILLPKINNDNDINSEDSLKSQVYIRKSKNTPIEVAEISSYNPLHSHVGHSMVYNPKSHQLLIISSGIPRQQNTTSFLTASRRQILAYDINTNLVYDLTAKSKLSHIPYTGYGLNFGEIPDTNILHQLEYSYILKGWPPYHHKFFECNKSKVQENIHDNAQLLIQNSFQSNAIANQNDIKQENHIIRNTQSKDKLREDSFHETIHQLLRKFDGILTSGNLDLFRVDSTQHQCILDQENQELHIYETLIFDPNTASHVQCYTYSTLWIYSLEKDSWMEVKHFTHDLSKTSTIPHPRFSTQFVYNENSKQFFLYGGNPGLQIQPTTKLGDLHSWTITIPSEEEIRNVVLFFIYIQMLMEMDSTDTQSILFLQEIVSTTLEHISNSIYLELLLNQLHHFTHQFISKEIDFNNLNRSRKALLNELKTILNNNY